MSQTALRYEDESSPARSVSPLLELGAYEALWLDPSTTWKRMADRFRAEPDALPSDFVPHDIARATGERAVTAMHEAGVRRFGVRVHGAGEYPDKLRDALNPVEVLCYQGWWSLAETPNVAVVGTRQPSEEGRRRARALVRRLVADGWTITSGLAAGIDTVAHQATLEAGGRTIAVLGTPLTHAYPGENALLQAEIADNFLAISQVPVLRYEERQIDRRSYFPERNATMSALSSATIIVEASDTSGTLYQGRAALAQGRKLFILDSCFNVPNLTWPHRFAARGAIRVRDYEDVRKALGEAHPD